MSKEYISELLKGDDKEFVFEYLTKKKIINGKTYKSSYYACLEHARYLTGRCQKDGMVDYEERVGSWAGACMYMILIDHIGGLFRKIRKVEKDNDFLNALSHFSNIDDNKATVLYQLRNSFVHSFSLYNFPKKNGYAPRIFSVHRGSPLINLPTENWLGGAEIKEENKTHISLFELGNLVEQMHKSVLESLGNSTLIIRIPKNGNFTAMKILEINTICY